MIDYNFYQITALTNMHVGSGDANFGVVDNLIQRDPTTNFPYINSSSLKGAIREFFAYKGLEGNNIEKIFGSSPKASAGGEKSKRQQGMFYFFNAYILSLPARSDIIPYFNATCPQSLNLLLNMYKQINKGRDFKLKEAVNDLLKNLPQKGTVNISDKFQSDKSENGTVENLEVESYIKDNLINNELKDLLGNNPAIFNDEDFSDELAKNLPVIARNHLDNGISENLWYEEIVPRDSRFFFIAGMPKDDPLFKKFNETIESEPVQIGANASIGYGFCEIKRMELLNGGIKQ